MPTAYATARAYRLFVGAIALDRNWDWVMRHPSVTTELEGRVARKPREPFNPECRRRSMRPREPEARQRRSRAQELTGDQFRPLHSGADAEHFYDQFVKRIREGRDRG
jgi:hypothetical protein